MVVESSLDQQRTGYLVKVSIMYVMLMVDLAANSIADQCRRKDTAPLPPSSAAASLRRAVTQRCRT